MITLKETTKLTLDGLNNLKLGEETVEFVYYRAGYSSNDYLSDWENLKEAMEVIELSNAVKVPDATMKLVNSKRMQAELSNRKFMKIFNEGRGRDSNAFCDQAMGVRQHD